MEVDATSSVYNYVVTAHKPTAVNLSVVGNFTSPTDINLIVAKSTRIEIHTLTVDGLQGVLDVPIYGRIASLELFRPKGEPKDLLFLHTERYKFCVLEYVPPKGDSDNDKGELKARANGDVQDKIGRPADFGQLGLIDPECRMIGLHLYDGLFKVLPLNGTTIEEAFNVRLEELSVLDMVFLTGCQKPTVALLYQDTKGARHAKTYVVTNKELEEGPWSWTNLDSGSTKLIAVPKKLGGCIVVGESVITYITKHADGAKEMKSVSLKYPAVIKAYGRIDDDGTRYLLSDHMGNLMLLVLGVESDRVVGLKLEIIGKTSVAASINYLDRGVVFIGSRGADSQLIRMDPVPIPGSDPASYVEVLQTFTNLGPIVDFCVVDMDRQGQGQVVTCSNIAQDGSLRIIRNGIGINEQATVELQGIKGVWSLRSNYAADKDQYLVLTFVRETRLLAFNAEEVLDEVQLPGWDANSLTLYCGNTNTNQLLQVTSSEVRLIDCATLALVQNWTPPAGRSINMASGSPSQVLVACGEGVLAYIEVTPGGQLQERGTLQMDTEVACVDISPLGEGSVASELAAVGTWGMKVVLVALPSLAEVRSEALGGDVIPRSVLLASFEGVSYCLCGQGDGVLLTWQVDGSGALKERKKVALGTKPILLKTFRSNNCSHVFAASDRPTIIYSSNKKLLYSNLNENEVNFMSSFNSAPFPDSLAIAKDQSMTIGTIDEIQKLHVRTVPLHEQPRRIVYQDTNKVFGVFTIGMPASGAAEDDVSHLRILDGQTYELLTSYQLDTYETGLSIISTTFTEDVATYFVVGTAYVRPEEHEPTKGRILVLQYEDSKLQVLAEKEVKGAVYCMLPFQGKLLACTNNRVQLFKWQQRDDGSKELFPECHYLGNVLALYMAARGDFIVVGDLMKSITLLMYKADEGALDMAACDFNSNWLTAVEMLDDDTYLAAENSNNLFVVRKNSDVATDEDRSRLEPVGKYHLGEHVNRIRPGSLVMRLPDSELQQIPTLLWGSVDGSLGVIAALPPQLFEFLNKLQDCMRKVVAGVGGFSHSDWRSFTNERETSESRNFIDGDLIEQLLELPEPTVQQVAAMMGEGTTVEELSRRVEELSRLH